MVDVHTSLDQKLHDSFLRVLYCVVERSLPGSRILEVDVSAALSEQAAYVEVTLSAGVEKRSLPE